MLARPSTAREHTHQYEDRQKMEAIDLDARAAVGEGS